MLDLIGALTVAIAALPPAQSTVLLREKGEPALAVFHEPGNGSSVLYIHGSTFPTALSIAYRLDGSSWADDLHARGFDVWSLDFAGYGGSDRPAANSKWAEIPGRAAEAEREIERVIRYIKARRKVSRVSLIAHSWGTLPAGMFAARHPDEIDKLVLFGPVAQRQGHRQAPATPSRMVTAKDQWDSFQSGVPVGERSPISPSRFAVWARTYLATDHDSSTRNPAAVQVPAGPDADFAEAWSGHFPYDPSPIIAPTLIVRGEWDPIARDDDARWLAAAMTSVPGGVRDVKLPRGAHRMHLEDNRQSLFDAVGWFLGSDRQ